MAASILSHPFRIIAGQAVTVDQDSDQAHAEQLAVLVMTRRGERALAVDFGITDPAFVGIRPSELAGQVARWGPPVRLAEFSAEPSGPDRVRLRVSFT